MVHSIDYEYLIIKENYFENNFIELTSDNYYFNGIIKMKSYDKNKRNE